MKFRKVNSLVVVAVSFACFMGGMFLERYTNTPANKSIPIECYRSYFIATEHLLDLIDAKWSWVDAFEHQPYYDTKNEVIFLDWQEIDRAQKNLDKVLDWETQQNK